MVGLQHTREIIDRLEWLNSELVDLRQTREIIDRLERLKYLIGRFTAYKRNNR